MPSLSGRQWGKRTERPIALGLCAALVAGWLLQRAAPNPDGGSALGPDWLPLVAAGAAAAGLVSAGGSARWRRTSGAFAWAALLLAVWVANGLLFDVLTLAGLMGRKTASGELVMATVYWPGLVTRAAAFATAVVLARRLFATPDGPRPDAGAWYGYAAFVLALPYPLLRTHWALGGTIGLSEPGAAGEGWEPLLIAIPWVAAAILSLLLIRAPRWIPRRLLLTAGWTATGIVAMIGPAAIWAFLSTLGAGGDAGNGGIALWVFGLFYCSWFFWMLAGGAATRSYQVRTAPRPAESPG